MKFGVRDHFQVLKVSEGTCTGKIFLGVGDHFQVLQVPRGTCTEKTNGGGGPLPGPSGARRDMYGTAYVMAILLLWGHLLLKWDSTDAHTCAYIIYIYIYI